MAGSSDLRASDEDRERVAQELRQHYGAGRLKTDEFEERLSAAYDAVTIGDLTALGRDLPPVEVGPGGGGGAGSGGSKSGKAAGRRSAGGIGLAVGSGPGSGPGAGSGSGTRAESHALALRETRDAMGRRALQNGGRRLVVFGGCTAIWAVTGGFFWPVFVLIYTLVVAARSCWALYGPSPDVARIERELWRQRRHEARRVARRRGREIGEEAMGWWIAQTSAKQSAAELRRRERDKRE